MCTDQYEVCVVKIEEVKEDTEKDGKVEELDTEGDTEDKVMEESSGADKIDTTDETDLIDESSGDGIGIYND